MKQDTLFYIYSNEHSLPAHGGGSLNFTADGKQFRSLQKLYTQLNKEFRFGGSFGNNLDALFDSMTDLSWLEEKKFFLIFKNTEDFLADETDEKIIDFLNTINDIGGSINDEPMFSDHSRSIRFYFQQSRRIEQLLDDAYLIWEFI